MILTIPLQVGTTLANVRYKWITSGVEGSALSAGVTQPSASYPVFRLSVTPPDGAEELIVYDSTDVGNWNVAGYKTALLAPSSGATNMSPDLASLKTICAAMLDIPEASFTVNSLDLFLVAANNARKKAEKVHNFENTRVVLDVTISDGTGGDLDTATVVQGIATNGVKEVISVSTNRSAQGYYPLAFSRADIPMEADRYRGELGWNNEYDLRYPSDRDVLLCRDLQTIIQRGRKIFIYPDVGTLSTAVVFRLEAYGWLENYGSIGLVTEPEDFIVEHGSEYLQWSIVSQLNFVFKNFVLRQEGTIASPEKQADEALQALILWDSYMVDSHITRSR